MVRDTNFSYGNIGWLYFLDKNYFLEESDYLYGRLPDKTEPQISVRAS